MNYIDNVKLSILISLLMGDDVVINAHDLATLKELEIYISTLDSLTIKEPENMTLEQEEDFKESYKPCITYKVSTHRFTIKVSCNKQDQLREYLTEYARLFELGELCEVGYCNMFESAETLEKMLIGEVKNIKTSKTRYKLIDIRFAPLILCKYLENEEFIKSLKINLLSENAIAYPIKLYEYDSSEDITGMAENWQNNFLCLYELNIAWYLEEFNKKESKTIAVKRRTKYSEQQKKMLEYIVKTVDSTKRLEIDPYYLARTCRIKEINLDTAVSRLNKMYREINNTDKTLLRKRRKTDLYDVLPNFIPSKEN